MPTFTRLARLLTEGVAAAMVALIFLTFILQIAVRYIVGSETFTALTGGVIDAAAFGWTVEFILVLWFWLIFWGNAFIVRDRDHVTFDIAYNMAGPRLRAAFAVIGAVIITVALWSAIEPTYDKMRLLRLKSSATLPVKMLPIYSVFFLFLAVVGLRYALRAIKVLRFGAGHEMHVLPYADVPDAEDPAAQKETRS